MSERDVIESSPEPVTRDRIVADLHRLGVSIGDTLIVHSSLSAIGYVIGGAQTVVEALIESIGPTGTLTMPGHSGALSEPSYWKNPTVSVSNLRWRDYMKVTLGYCCSAFPTPITLRFILQNIVPYGRRNLVRLKVHQFLSMGDVNGSLMTNLKLTPMTLRQSESNWRPINCRLLAWLDAQLHN